MKEKYAMVYKNDNWVGAKPNLAALVAEVLINKQELDDNIEDFYDSMTKSQKNALNRWLTVDKNNDIKIRDIKEKIMLLSKTDDWLSKNPPEFIYPTLQHWRPFHTPMENEGIQLLGKVLEDVQQYPCVYTSFRATCDGTFLQDRGIPCVVFGPGGIGNCCHGPNEYVDVEELVKCAKVYALFAYRWSG